MRWLLQGMFGLICGIGPLVMTLFCGAAALQAQGVGSETLLKPPSDSWPTYYGDYTGRRYSSLSQINKDNAGMLTLA
ncbi:MAG TPA: hypothetical protein VGR96_10405, partial [Acidobacteriaceae bacterium]|nr:hypothetical protein [Acidobacteriaceae bacterium]